MSIPSREREKLENIIDASSLDPEKKLRWKEYLPILADFTLIELGEALTAYPELFGFITNNWEMKRKIFQEEGRSAEDDVLKFERKELEAFLLQKKIT